MNKSNLMRFLLSVFLLFSIGLFAQKMPVGLIVKFQDGVSFSQKQMSISTIPQVKALTKEHELKGFDVSIVEGNGEYTEEQYLAMRERMEEEENVVFTSILYKTSTGAIGGDLEEMYLKPKHKRVKMIIDMVDNGVSKAKPHNFFKDVWVFYFDKNTMDIRTVQEKLIASGQYEFVTVNTLHTVLATVDDPYFENQWSIENEGTALHFDGTVGADMQVSDAWDLTTGDPTIKVAVLDSGTDTNHVDLVGNLLPGFDATGGDSKGYPNTTYSNDGHGTCTAGIIGAIGDNGVGIAGVAYDCKVIPVKIFYYITFGSSVIPFTSSAAGIDGINWAINTANADVISNSWGLRNSDIITLGIDTALSNLTIINAIENGRDGKGTPMLFSSGNDYDAYSIWPASYALTISVGASSMCDELKSPSDCSPENWWGSNYGANLDVTAPGVKVLATDMTGDLGYNGFIDDNYSMFNGTSAACPNAAGVMALILSANPDLTAVDARGILSITAEKVGGYDYTATGDYGTKSTKMGYGRVNAYEAVNYASYFAGVKELKEGKDWIRYANNQTVLVLDNAENADVTIVNMLGAKVGVVAMGQISNGQIIINDYVTTSGMYLIQVNRGGEEVVLKAVVK